MRHGADQRPSLFKTFRFTSFDEAAAFVAQLSRLGAEAASLIAARIAGNAVRIRIDPHPEHGKAASRKVLEDLEGFHRHGF